jgi:hypothetical protein
VDAANSNEGLKLSGFKKILWAQLFVRAHFSFQKVICFFCLLISSSYLFLQEIFFLLLSIDNTEFFESFRICHFARRFCHVYKG